MNERQQPAWSGSYYDDDTLFDFYCESVKGDAIVPTTTALKKDDTISSITFAGVARNKSEIKPQFKKGDRVYANWIHDYDGKYWYRGTIDDFTTLPNKTHPIYGPVRVYSILFDDGTRDKSLSEDKVMREMDYSLFTDKKLRKSWTKKGITNEYDVKSDDAYARYRGWFETEKTGKMMFTSLTDAINAYGLVIQKKDTKKDAK